MKVTSSVEINGQAPGSDLAALFKQTGDHIWTLKLKSPLKAIEDGRLTVSVKDKQGNVTEIDRHFSIK